MTHREFGIFLNAKLERCRKVLDQKGSDYTQGSLDRLINFKRLADHLNINPKIVWLIYFIKPIDAIMTYSKGGVLKSEPIEDRFTDAINYLLLGEALFRDESIESAEIQQD